MPDYEKMYFNLQRKVSDAVETLINAQQEGEDAYVEEAEKAQFPHSTESTD